MTILKRIFSNFSSSPADPTIQFGRFSDSYKEERKYDAWDKALEYFHNGSFLHTYLEFFQYLEDDAVDNVSHELKDGVIRFEFYQGSKLITGHADYEHFYAEAKIARINTPSKAVYRQLLEANYQLKYSRYAIDDDQNLTIVFRSHSDDASPYKLYYALKELSVTADKTDDVLIDKHKELDSINLHHIRSITDEEKEVKYTYVHDAFDKLEQSLSSSTLNLPQHPGAVSYLFLDLFYRIDFLIKPEGQIMEWIRNVHEQYFNDSIKTVDQKNAFMHKAVKAIKEEPKEDFFKELYEVKSTFGITAPKGKSKMQDFISSEIENISWYEENGHDCIARAIPSFVVGYCLYNFNMPVPMRHLLRLFFKISQAEYFKKLGYVSTFHGKNGRLSKRDIRRAIQDVLTDHEEDYTHESPDTKRIDYSTQVRFAHTYLEMINQLEFKRKDNR